MHLVAATPRLGPNYARMCVSGSEGHGFFFRLQVSEMSEKILVDIGVKFAASHDMYKSDEKELQSMQSYTI